jgi:hypothetical protein
VELRLAPFLPLSRAVSFVTRVSENGVVSLASRICRIRSSRRRSRPAALARRFTSKTTTSEPLGPMLASSLVTTAAAGIVASTTD